MKTSTTQKRYDRFSKFYDAAEIFIEKFLFSKLRKKTLRKLHGSVLEIGVGTGKNLKYYNSDVKIHAIDISSGMMQRAKKKRARKNVKFYKMDAQKLDFDDDTFDYVYGSFVLCSIPDPVLAIKEAKRVLKPDGKIIFIEHVLSKYPLIALWEQVHNPFTRYCFGCNVNRNTKRNLQKGGVKIISDEKLAFFDVFRKFVCVK